MVLVLFRVEKPTANSLMWHYKQVDVGAGVVVVVC